MLFFKDKAGISGSILARRLLFGTGWTLFGRATSSLAGFVVNALIARLIPPDSVGSYFLIVSVVMLAATVGQLGLQIAVVRLVAEAMGKNLHSRARAAIVAVLKIGSLCAAVVAVLIYAGRGLIAKDLFRSPAMADAMWVAPAWILAATVSGLLAESFRGFHDYRRASVYGGAITNLLMVLMLGAVLAWHFRGGLQMVLALSLCAVFVNLLLAALATGNKLRGFEKSAALDMSKVVEIGLPLMVTSIAIFVTSQADLWILGAFRSKDEVALYGTAVRLVQLVMMPMLIANAVLPPIISEMHAQGKTRELERIIRGVAALSGLPAIFVLGCFVIAGNEILATVYGEFYRSGGTALIIVSAGQVVNVLVGSGAVTLMMTGHQRAIMNISLLSGSVLILGSLMLVGNYGANGVACAYAAGASLHAVATLFWVKYKTGMWTHVGFAGLRDLMAILPGQPLVGAARNAECK